MISTETSLPQVQHRIYQWYRPEFSAPRDVVGAIASDLRHLQAAGDLGCKASYTFLRARSPPGENAHHLTWIGTGQLAAPILSVGKSACVQVVNGFGDPGGAANQQDPHLLLAGC